MISKVNGFLIWLPSILLIIAVFLLAKYTAFFNSLESNLYAELTGVFINIILIAALIEFIKFCEKEYDNYMFKHVVTQKIFNTLNIISNQLIESFDIDKSIINKCYEENEDRLDDSVTSRLHVKLNILKIAFDENKFSRISIEKRNIMFERINDIASNLERFSNSCPETKLLPNFRQVIEGFILTLENDPTFIYLIEKQLKEDGDTFINPNSTGIFISFASAYYEELSYYAKEIIMKRYIADNWPKITDDLTLNVMTSFQTKNYFKKKR